MKYSVTKRKKLTNLLRAVADTREYWLNAGKDTKSTLDGFIFSLFAMFDGCAGFNDCTHLIIKDGRTAINDNIYLHDQWVHWCKEFGLDK